MSTASNIYIGLARNGGINESISEVVHSTTSGGVPGLAAAVTDFNTALSAYDAEAAAIVAITGDTYSATTHQFTSGGATGLTHAQVATMEAALNTFATDLLTLQTAMAAIVAAGGGSAVDVELRLQVNNGTQATGLVKNDVHRLVDVLLGYVDSNGAQYQGTDNLVL